MPPKHTRISHPPDVTPDTPLGRSLANTSRTILFLIALFAVARVVDRYRKGKTTLMGNLWWEVHENSMIVCAEALLPLAITAIVTTGGPHSSSHAQWGEDMHGRMRSPGLETGGKPTTLSVGGKEGYLVKLMAAPRGCTRQTVMLML